MGTGVAGEEPADQRHRRRLLALFDSAPLTERLEILGAPEFELELAADKPVAQLCARLCDVAPDGASRRVSYGVLNLTHRDSHAEPEPLEPGRFYRIRLKLNDCGYRFAPGHRLRAGALDGLLAAGLAGAGAATLTLRLPRRADAAGAARIAPTSPPSPSSRRSRPPRRADDQGRRGPARARRRRSISLTGVATYVTHGEGGLFGEGVLRFDEIDTTFGTISSASS